MLDRAHHPGPLARRLHRRSRPGAAQAQVGGRTVNAYALGHHADIAGGGWSNHDGTHGVAEAKILGGGYARVSSRCNAWSATAGPMTCTISTSDPPPPPGRTWAAYAW